MTHYVCLGCGGVADNPGVCQTDGCRLKGEQLKECHCTDGNHQEVLGKKEEPAEQEQAGASPAEPVEATQQSQEPVEDIKID